MADIKGYVVSEDLFYHKEHMWVKVDGDVAIVGLDDFAQKLAGEISFVDLPSEGDSVSKDEAIGSFETGKWMGKFFAPVSGEIIEKNNEVEDDPSLINSDPYGKGWIIKIKMSNKDELNSLMKYPDVEKWLNDEIAKHVKK
uniref:Glycine cleavage system H protein n=1 Tax=candidate division WOR-3 bacterium TaxID=2052148 RepID=A0A7C4UCL7_UNCW3